MVILSRAKSSGMERAYITVEDDEVILTGGTQDAWLRSDTVTPLEKWQ